MSETFHQLAPYYIAIGMTADEYWKGNPYLAKEYSEAHKLRVEERNQEMWLQGFYIWQALEVAFHNHPAMPIKSIKPEKYLEKPIRITPLTEAEKAEERKRKLDSVVSYFTMYQANWEKRYGGSNNRQN